jgi:hypothetical protein
LHPRSQLAEFYPPFADSLLSQNSNVVSLATGHFTKRMFNGIIFDVMAAEQNVPMIEDAPTFPAR